MEDPIQNNNLKNCAKFTGFKSRSSRDWGIDAYHLAPPNIVCGDLACLDPTAQLHLHEPVPWLNLSYLFSSVIDRPTQRVRWSYELIYHLAVWLNPIFLVFILTNSSFSFSNNVVRLSVVASWRNHRLSVDYSAVWSNEYSSPKSLIREFWSYLKYLTRLRNSIARFHWISPKWSLRNPFLLPVIDADH